MISVCQELTLGSRFHDIQYMRIIKTRRMTYWDSDRASARALPIPGGCTTVSLRFKLNDHCMNVGLNEYKLRVKSLLTQAIAISMTDTKIKNHLTGLFELYSAYVRIRSTTGYKSFDQRRIHGKDVKISLPMSPCDITR